MHSLQAVILTVALAASSDKAERIPTTADGDYRVAKSTVPIPGNADYICLYKTGRKGTEVYVLAEGKPSSKPVETEVQWRIRSRSDGPVNLGATRYVASLDPVKYVVQFGKPMVIAGARLRGINANRVELLDGGTAVIYPMGLGKLDELEAPPVIVKVDDISTVRTSLGAMWGFHADFGDAAYNRIIPEVDEMPMACTIPFPAMAQDKRAGCVLNGFKMAMLQNGLNITVKEMIAKLGLTERQINRTGVPWSSYHVSTGAVYSKLGLTNTVLIRALKSPALDWIDKREAFALDPGVIRVHGGTSSKPLNKKQLKGNWLMHGILKRLLAGGRPVIIDLHKSRLSHVVTVWGYDTEKRGYIVNYGITSGMAMLSTYRLDGRWADFKYDTIVVRK
jgi:hypothetical protein